MSRLVRVCKTSDLPPGERIAVEISGKSILLVNCNGRFYSVSNLCTHEQVELVNGFLLDDEIVCSAHLSRFKLETGEVLNPPATIPLGTYKTLVQNDEVFVEA
jgi:nitrite reductase/ring-hydroxylating ferredoxin subunit